MTAFTGTVRLQGKNGNSADLFGLRFAGDSGIGVDAYCFVYISGCSFDGFDTAAIARNGGWVCAADSTFTNNRTALKLIQAWLTVPVRLIRMIPLPAMAQRSALTACRAMKSSIFREAYSLEMRQIL